MGEKKSIKEYNGGKKRVVELTSMIKYLTLDEVLLYLYYYNTQWINTICCRLLVLSSSAGEVD